MSITAVPEWGTQKNFRIIEGDDLKSYLDTLGPKESVEARAQDQSVPADDPVPTDAAAPMERD